MRWYAIFVETGYEDEVCKFINKLKTYLYEDIDFHFLVPKKRIYEKKQGVRREVIKRMFPGYVLVETDNIYEFYKKALRSPHIIKFIKNHNEFQEVNQKEINQILHMSNRNGLIDISKGFVINDKITICDGPLLGAEGIIKRIDKRKGRAKVEFFINEKPLLIDLGVELIQKVNHFSSLNEKPL